MKVTIHCDNDYEARCCMRAQDMLTVLRELDRKMRNVIKYGDQPDQITHQWRQTLRELCDDYRVDLDDDAEVA